jgi:hypothetical protein
MRASKKVRCFPHTGAPDKPHDPYHRVVHALSQTTDAGFHFTRDVIAAAEDAGSKPGKQVGASKSVKDCRLSARSKLAVRSASRVGITGGDVAGAKDDTIPTWGKDDVLARRRTIGSRKSKQRTAKQIRGYR